MSRPWNLFPVIVLLSAFLLFQSELILAKYILPWFGGTPAVWNTCMMFYQAVLLCGYCYSHWLCTRFDFKKQTRIHTVLVATAFAAVAVSVAFSGSPLTPAAHWKYFLSASPVIHIVILLAMAVGVPFFLLSTTGPLMQSWYSRLYPEKASYRLYAISNLGSLVGLLGYPFLLEWLLPVKKQALLWTGLFVLFLLVCAFQNWMVGSRPFAAEMNAEAAEDEESHRFGAARSLRWIGLSACASVMLFATTNQVCQNIPVSPFLWVIPLSIYLLSFTICFESSRWYRRPVFYSLYFISIGLTARTMLASPDSHDELSLLSVYLLLLFTVCMVCHGELERLKPPGRLTSFYVNVGIGGALGGAFVVLVAPHLFHAFYELHVAVLATGLLILAVSVPRALRMTRSTKVWRRQRWGWIACALTSVAAISLFAFATRVSAQREAKSVVEMRNFFGLKRVYDEDGSRYLKHGGIVHGAQFLAEARQMSPTMYYSPHTGLGLLLNNYRRLTGRGDSDRLRIGVIGLGAGTLAAYAKPGDTMRFYEVDPQVIELAGGPHAAFTFVQKSQGNIQIVLGDARLSLESEAARGDLQNFDVLVVDAFGGDAPPIHLLTREAMHLYLRHLRGPDSVIAVNIANRVLDFTPVLRALSADAHLSLDDVGNLNRFDWVLLSRNKKILQDPSLYFPFDWSDSPVLWTDDYSNLLSILKK